MKATLAGTLCALIALSGAAVARAQDLLVGEYFTNQIWRVAPDGTRTLFAQPAVPPGVRLVGFAFDAAGNLYAARLEGATANANDPNNGILKITPGGAISAFGGFVPGLPVDTAVDAAGNVYVSSYFTGQIRRFSPAGVDLGVFATVGGDAYNIAFDGAGTLFVASSGSGEIRRFSSAGADLGVFATVGSATSLAFDALGDVYVGTNVGTIRRFSSGGADLGLFASTPGALFDGLAFSSGGDLFAANFQNVGGNIQRFSPQGASLGVFSPGIASPFGIGFVPAAAVAVPEAGTFAMALPALGLVGAAIIKRRKRA